MYLEPLTLGLAAAVVKDPPIIDLDSTALVQLAIFVVTMLVLKRYLFRPYLEVKAARAAGIEGARDEAHRLDEEAQAKLGDYDRAFAQARSRAGAERAKLQEQAVAREREISAAARQATQDSLEQARQKLQADAAAARRQLEPRAQEIARAVTRKILGREVS